MKNVDNNDNKNRLLMQKYEKMNFMRFGNMIEIFNKNF